MDNLCFRGRLLVLVLALEFVFVLGLVACIGVVVPAFLLFSLLVFL